MGERIAALDWRRSPLGSTDHWPTALKTLLATMLVSKQPMFLAWGAEQTWFYNDAFIPILGRKHPLALGRASMAVWSEARELLGPLFERVYAGEPVAIEDFSLELDRDGRLAEAHFEFAYTPARSEDGQVYGLFGTCIETTGRVRAERLQALAVEQQRRQFQAAPGFIAILTGPDHVFDFANDAYTTLIGNRELRGKPVREVVPEVVDQGFFELLDAVFTTGRRYVAHHTPIRLQRTPNSPLEQRFLDFIYEPILGESGEVTGIFVEGFDVTEAHLTQEMLEDRVQARSHELQEAQHALAQAQKIEAIGQLTGGVAHDFNNLLMVILGGLSMIERGTDEDRRRRVLDGMRNAAERGASLSRQLLAYSRRQPLKPQTVDLADRLRSMRELLDRTLRGDVHVRNEIAGDLWPVLVDSSELELVMLNLCVNARDAMPNGGTITIRAENVRKAPVNGEAGDFVKLSVEDDGQGMSSEVLARVFEPFFTTKDVGKGSGLGLAQVQGFAEQSGGTAVVESELGRGTSVSLWLPRSHEQPVSEPPSVDLLQPATAHPRGCILLVEDDQEVARLVAEMLDEIGYEVVHAASAEAALGGLANDRPVDLLFSDIMMPGEMNGLDLARETRRRRPGIPILLSSGYAEAAIAAAAQENFRVLGKPYDIRALSEAIATMLA